MSLKLNERYPGRFDNPSADYPQGSFKNRTAPDAKDGSYLEKDWANDKEGFFQSLLAAAGVTANGSVDKVGSSQFYNALLQAFQSQSGAAFPAAGTAPAFTLSPAPAIAAYAQNQRFQVSFSAAGGATPTLNISGRGAKNLKQYNSAGSKVAAVIVSGQTSDVFYDGTDLVLLDPLFSGRALSDGDFAVPILARANIQIPQGSGLQFYDSGSSSIFYRSLHDASGWVFTTVPATGPELVSFSVSRATSQVNFNIRPSFAGQVPWDAANKPKSTALLSANGWIKDADTGVITQWGWANVGDDQILDVTLPVAFPNAFTSASATAQTSTPTTSLGTWAGTAFRKSNSVISVGANSSSGAGVTPSGVCWLAIGY